MKKTSDYYIRVCDIKKEYCERFEFEDEIEDVAREAMNEMEDRDYSIGPK